MYKRQDGLLPLLSKTLGLLLLGTTAIVCLRLAVDSVMHGRTTAIQYGALDFIFDVSAGITFGVLLMSPIWLLGMLLLSMFPQIRLTNEGLKYRVIRRQRLIRWREIEKLIELRNGVTAITISRTGSHLLNGLYFNSICGFMIRHEKPVVFLAPGLQDRDAVVREIVQMSSAKSISKPDELYT